MTSSKQQQCESLSTDVKTELGIEVWSRDSKSTRIVVCTLQLSHLQCDCRSFVSSQTELEMLLNQSSRQFTYYLIGTDSSMFARERDKVLKVYTSCNNNIIMPLARVLSLHVYILVVLWGAVESATC